MEVLIVDGISDDGTREIVRHLAEKDGRIRLIDNPRRIVPYAMNAGIRESKGSVILRIDGHATVAQDFILRNAEALAEHPEAWCVGGSIETVNHTYVGRVIAGSMSSPVGVGNAMFRLGDYEGYVDTMAWGAYRRWVFEKIGMFDEELIRNQDDELNFRVVKGGGKIWITPTIRSQYYPRASLRKLWRQYYQYGFWRIRTMQKHRQAATPRQLVPLLFVSVWLALIAVALIWRPAAWALGGFAAMYALGLLLGALDVARRVGLVEGLLAPVAFAILHFGYGLGSLKGIFWFLILRRGGKLCPEEYRLSR